jgi:hypothetical protein
MYIELYITLVLPKQPIFGDFKEPLVFTIMGLTIEKK